jgi:RNA polymerase sigma factor (sigma-70 family)
MAETEAVLLRRFARTGDAEAFAEIIRRHAGLVYGAALRVLADMDRAADVAQDTFLQLTKDARGVTGSLPGWLHRVATHKAIDQMRRETARRHRETAYAAGRPRQIAEWKDISRHIDEGLNELDPEMRDILIAYFLDSQTTRHIATVRGISQATVSRRIESGVASLRGVLRRRGIIVAAGTLSLLLGEKTLQAAPASLMSELGKIAMIGGHATVVSTAAAEGSSGFQGLISGILASAKAKAIVAASVAVVGVSSVVTYRYVARPALSPSTPETVATVSAQPLHSVAGLAAPRSDESVFHPGVLQSLDSAVGNEKMFPMRASARDLGDVAVSANPHAEPNASAETSHRGMMDGMAVGGHVTDHAPYKPPATKDPNDSNDRSDDKSQEQPSETGLQAEQRV